MKRLELGVLLLLLLFSEALLSGAVQIDNAKGLQRKRKSYKTSSPNSAKYSTPIKTVVVLMFENRSFDHMLGRLKTKIPEVEGYGTDADTKYFNYLNVSNPSSGKVYVHHKYMDRGWCDYDHSIQGTTMGIFGENNNRSKPAMSGFVEHNIPVCNPQTPAAKSYYGNGGVYATQGENVMAYFEPEDVPIISTLAENFAVFDQYRASAPGPTHVNRFFVHSGTAHGEGEYNPTAMRILKGWPQKTIYPPLREAGYSWRDYFALIPEAIFLDELRHIENIHHFSYMEEFFAAARKGTLPNYVFLEPAYFGSKEKGLPAQDQHPDHSIRAGEALLKEVYEALRASPQWNEVLFLVTYDEHGGFYDHVPPPMDIPSPDGIATYDGDVSPPFNFNRAGVRIPFIAISPWIDKQVVHAPPATAKPQSNSLYEHSSILATVGKLFPQLGSKALLTKRVQWAATFEHLINRKTPRTDCPMTLPNVPTMTATELEAEWNQELSHLQLDLLQLAAHMTGFMELSAAKLKGDAAALLDKVMKPYFSKVWGEANKALGTVEGEAKKGYRKLEHEIKHII